MAIKMRTKKPILIALFLCTWSIVSYYLLIRQTDAANKRYPPNGLDDSRRYQGDLLRQLDRLETSIQEENVIHDQLVKRLIDIIRLKSGKESDKSNPQNNYTQNKAVQHASNPVIASLDQPVYADNELKASNDETMDSETQLINRLRELNTRNKDNNGPIIPVLVFACNRISVRNCLDDLVQYRPNAYQFPIIVSQVSD